MSERKRENTVNFAPGPAALPDEVPVSYTRSPVHSTTVVLLRVPPRALLGGPRGAGECLEPQGIGARRNGYVVHAQLRRVITEYKGAL